MQPVPNAGIHITDTKRELGHKRGKRYDLMLHAKREKTLNRCPALKNASLLAIAFFGFVPDWSKTTSLNNCHIFYPVIL